MLSLASTATILAALIGLVPQIAPSPGSANQATLTQDPAVAKPVKPATELAPPVRPAATTATPAGTAHEANVLKPNELAEQFRSIREEYNTLWNNAETASKAGKTRYEQSKIRVPLRPDEAAFARRMLDLALLDPGSKTARDAAIWVMDKTWMSDNGPFMGSFETAANLLVFNHADDPEAVRVGLQLDNMMTRRRDGFIEGCYANATSHEPKGLARMAYAQYLEHKVPLVRAAHKFPERNELHGEKYDDAGKLVPVTYRESNLDFAYDVSLRWLDADKLRAEAVRLYQEVIADYADVSYINCHRRRLETMIARPLKPDATVMAKLERASIEQFVKQAPPTLADVARQRLYGMNQLAVGQPAPEVVGIDVMTGQPFKLSEQRGKVVLLLPWADEYLELVELAKQREARERASGRPFVVLGVVIAKDRGAARESIEKHQLPWLNTFVALSDDGHNEPITRAYQFNNVTHGVLIDRDGKIAGTQVRKIGFDEAIDFILNSPNAPKP